MGISLSLLGKEIIFYGGIIVFVAGIIGSLLNSLVFLSLKTFRQSSCAFYLLTMSIANISQILFGLSSRITLAHFVIDGTESSLFYCKFRLYFFQACMAISITCTCLATIDQYFATCSRPRLQQLCNIKLAQRIVITIIIIWFLHGIPYIIYSDDVVSSVTNKTSCIITNNIYSQYRIIGLIVVIIGYVPVAIAVIFGSMAYYNIQNIAYRTVPLVRRELDKQLTVMVLTQILVDIFTALPYVTINGLLTGVNIISDPIVLDKVQFVANVMLVFYYAYVASPFYIYICVSERFRRQLIYVLFTIHFNRCRQTTAHNRVIPENVTQ